MHASKGDPHERIHGVVQVAHGMGEHIGRYGELIGALTAAGFAVYGNEHRGHGRTAPFPEALGDFGDGFDRLIEDMLRLRTYRPIPLASRIGLTGGNAR